MCGICGVWSATTSTTDELIDTARRMAAALAHRGPDSAGIWNAGSDGIALGHRRLSVVDLNTTGQQPMQLTGGRHVLIFNGEIYNHRMMRKELTRNGDYTNWRGTSDTEVLLATIDAWGTRTAVQRSNGMFALAAYDTRAHTLTLARDRMGEKPLYFGWLGRQFVFASEIKAFAALADWSPRGNLDALGPYLRAGYCDEGESAVRGIFCLPPATTLTLSIDDVAMPHSWDWIVTRLDTYWSLAAVASNAQHHPFDNAAAAEDEVETVLRDAVALRASADVPVGAFLSGGIDSSLITALMQSQLQRHVCTFSVGFDAASHDEAPYARAIAHYLGTNHTELYVDAKRALDLVPTLAYRFDEPFADFSGLPTLLVSELARQTVTVVLTGDGGDELFGGYRKYVTLSNLRVVRSFERLPIHIRRAVEEATFLTAKILAPKALDGGMFGSIPMRLRRFAHRIGDPRLGSLRLGAGSWQSYLAEHRSPGTVHPRHLPQLSDDLHTLMFWDQVDYLPNDILLKVDRSAMAYGLEPRIPLLDHRVIELAWKLPAAMLMPGTHGKQCLRHILRKYVPPKLFERPKQGSSPPLGSWLRGPLREWADSALADRRLRDIPLLDTKMVRRLWATHCAETINAAQALWTVIMLTEWTKRFHVSW